MNIVNKNGCLVVSFDKYIDEDNVEDFKKEIDAAYSQSESKDMVFDLSDSKAISDKAVGMTLGRYKRVLENDGQMYIAGAKGDVDKTLTNMDVYKVIPSYKNVKDIIM